MLILILCFVTLTSCDATINSQSVLRVYPNTEKDVQVVDGLFKSSSVEYWTDLSLERPVDIQITRRELEYWIESLKKNGINSEVFIELLDDKVNRHLEEVCEARANRNHTILDYDYMDYLNLTEIQMWLDNKIEECGNRCEKINFGISNEGREMWGIKISRGKDAAGKIFVDGGIHAREWASPASIVHLIDRLVSDYGSEDHNVTLLVNFFDWYILPVFNVDGHSYSWVSNETRLWRKTRSFNVLKPECIGTDPNRNFDHMWNTIGTDPDPCGATYAGPSAFSEYECRHVAQYLISLGEVDAYFTIHTYGQVILSPWGYTRNASDTDAEHQAVGELGARAILDTHGKNYTVGPSSVVLSYSSGTSRDWAYGEAKVSFSYTFELRDTGDYGFLMPPGEVKPTAQETWAAIEAMSMDIMRRKRGNQN